MSATVLYSQSRSLLVHYCRRRSLTAGLLIWLVSAASVQASGLIRSEENGRKIFHQGTSARSSEITAKLQGTEMEIPAAALPCAGCHGSDGKGRPEGGSFPTDLRWASLTRPYEVQHASGRRHPPYDERTVKRAITMGIDAGGNELQVSMPRYRLSQADMADLLAYLRLLGNEPEPGVSKTTITLGSLLVEDGPDGPDSAARAVLEAFFDVLNTEGGIYGRKVELRFPTTSTSRSSSLRSLIEGPEIFALVGGSMVGSEDQLAGHIDQIEAPWLGPLTFDPPVTEPLNQNLFYIYPGLEDQVSALAESLAGDFRDRGPITAVVRSTDPLAGRLEAALFERIAAHGWSPPSSWHLQPGEDPELLAESLAKSEPDAVFILLRGTSAGVLIEAARDRGLRARWLASGILSGRGLLDTQRDLSDVHLAYPSLPSDLDPRGEQLYRRLVRSHQIGSGRHHVQLAALAAAQLFVAAANRAGRDLTRSGLIRELESMYDFPTQFTRPVTFGPNRRRGIRGAHLVAAGPDGDPPRWVRVD